MSTRGERTVNTQYVLDQGFLFEVVQIGAQDMLERCHM